MKEQLTKWQVKGFWPGEPLWTTSVESTVQRRGVTPWMDVEVPGGVHRALEKAGQIADPYFGLNSLLCEWVEHRWWVFRTFFPRTEQLRGKRVQLLLEGLDDQCRVILNGQTIAEHEGMYEPVRCDVTSLLKDENQLLVVFEQPPREQGQIGWTHKTFTQKARFGYKWDFCTHLVNIGIWEKVWLIATGDAQLCDPYVTTDVEGGAGQVRVRTQVRGKCREAEVKLCKGGKVLESRRVLFDGAYDPALDTTFSVERPELWNPLGLGTQPLYEVEITVEGDSWRGRTGIRSLRYERCEGADAQALPYLPVVNGQKVYLRGVNITPLDMCYGDLRAQDYRRMFRKLAHMNVNLIRVWGGGIIEKEEFYHLADEYGVLVWQEFIQSSSGIDNMPGHDPAFLALLKRNSRAAICKCRGHVSLTFWSGGNELGDAEGAPITFGDRNVAMLRGLVAELDGERQFLPSSPSGMTNGRGHDVHGNWQYDGVDKHYEKYNRADSMLQSEFGADGMCSLMQLERTLPPEEIGVYTMKEHPMLRHHGEWWETLLNRDEPLFGDFKLLPRPVESWIGASQLMQAEAIRYIVLSNRRRRWRNCGSFIWQFNEPFPNVSCTNLVEYYGLPKNAYYAIRRAYGDTVVGLRYDSLLLRAGTEVTLLPWADSFSRAGEATLTTRVLTLSGQELSSGKCAVQLTPEHSVDGKPVTFAVPELHGDAALVRVTLEMAGQRVAEETWLLGQGEQAPLRAAIMDQARFTCREEGGEIVLHNPGSVAALMLHGEIPGMPDAILSDSFVTLLPGETRRLKPMGGETGWIFRDVTGKLAE